MRSDATNQFLLVSCNSICAGLFCLLLLLRLEDILILRWFVVFLPFTLGHLAAAIVHGIRLVGSLRERTEPNPATRLVQYRGLCEAAYKLAQSSGILVSALLVIRELGVLLTVAGLESSGLVAEKLSDSNSSISGVRTDQMQQSYMSWTLVAVPVWIAWFIESVVWVHYRQYRKRVIGSGLTPNHGHIKIRGHDEIFFANLILTLVARMLDGAYRYATWTLLFTVVWVQLSLVALLYVACFAFCVFGLVFSQSARFQAWNLSDYRNIFAKSLALVTCGSCTLALYFTFWTNLAKRLDGDHSVTFESILIPMMIKCGPEVLSALVLYVTGGTQATITESLRNAAEEGDKVEWEREKAAYAHRAPQKLVQQSSTFFRAFEAVVEATAAAGGAVSTTQEEEASVTNSVGAGKKAEGRQELRQGQQQDEDRGTEDEGGRECEQQPVLVHQGQGQQERLHEEELGLGDECYICLLAPREAAYLPCGHGGMCAECAHAAVDLPPHCCPICRSRVLKVALLELDRASGQAVFRCR